MFYGSGGSRSRLAKAAGAEQAGPMRDEELHTLVARTTFWIKKCQSTSCSDDFWKLRCRKSARRCGASASDDFWPLRCGKSAHHCGVKHISKSKCTKHRSLGALLDVEMWKKCTSLWREAHFQVKMYKAHHSWNTFGRCDVEKVTLLWREAHVEVKMYKTKTFCNSLVDRCVFFLTCDCIFQHTSMHCRCVLGKLFWTFVLRNLFTWIFRPKAFLYAYAIVIYPSCIHQSHSKSQRAQNYKGESKEYVSILGFQGLLTYY